ncbi:precorrin-4 C(11)-methyltransferase [Cohaesibacter sp. CAU 1516]|uniref:precorrin-4 C(11)-methyltransferase n=1 Tax=Cohaesibacter sp. CAU 1516 TaxID=2576038 RepID=UPI0010FD6721|nr:precorrin-4 C(11)-methyltransferase [Cohaesibacter sp. CAU 1516]TLP49266.1 precorrin-4 C(11)-methyltransferase [Cohaesibacter sp. CAU 1516]
MTVYFIGAGPGAPDLITVRGLKLIQSCPVCLYAGSLVPESTVAEAPEGALVKDTAPMHLDEIIADIKEAHDKGQDVARVHSGDPSIYGAIAEQIRRLDDLGIPFEVVPGVPAFAAAAAALGTELTVPGIAQTIILTRTAMKSSSMPEGESLDKLGASGATLAIHLSVRNIPQIERDLIPHYGEDCPAVVAYRVGWPDQSFIRGTLSTIRKKVREAKITRTALILVGPAMGAKGFADSKLYDADFSHVLRVGTKGAVEDDA